MRFLRKCSQFGEVYIGLNSDKFLEGYKGKPVFSYQERLTTLSDWGYNNILENNQEDGTIKSVVEQVNPDIIIIGSDWLRKDYLGQLALASYSCLFRHNYNTTVDRISQILYK